MSFLPDGDGTRAGAKLDVRCLYRHVCRAVSNSAAVAFLISGGRSFNALLRHAKPDLPSNEGLSGRKDEDFALHRLTANTKVTDGGARGDPNMAKAFAPLFGSLSGYAFVTSTIAPKDSK